MADDPHYNSVKLRPTFDGADEATSAQDFSLSGHILTFTGAAELDTAQKKFGTASAKFVPTLSGFFIDLFGETGDPLLAAHVPDVGTSWTQTEFGGYTGDLQLISANGTVSPDTTAANDGVIAVANATYPTNDYKAEMTVTETGASGQHSVGVLARIVDTNNYYVGFVLPAVAGDDTFIFKIVAGVASQLGSAVDLDHDFSTAVTLRLEVQGTALRFYINDVLQVSTTDGDHTTGQAGMAFGTGVDRNNDDVHTAWEIDNFVVVGL